MTGICRHFEKTTDPCHTALRRRPRSPFSQPGVSNEGVRHSPVNTDSLTELFWEFYSVIWVEEIPSQNCFGINSVVCLCGIVTNFHFSNRLPA